MAGEHAITQTYRYALSHSPAFGHIFVIITGKITVYRYPQNISEEQAEIDKRRFRISVFFTVFTLLLMWYIKILEVSLNVSYAEYGLYPRTLSGLKGILTAPFLHGSFSHLINNSTAFLILTISLLFFYKNVAFRVLLLSYLVTGSLSWIIARDSYHIGASGIVYAEAAFLFFSGVLRRNISLLAISMIVTFLYGSMVWGVFPVDLKISWESHLAGAVTGAVLALIYRHEGPPSEKPFWQDEIDDDDDEADDENAYWKIPDEENEKQ